MSNCIYNSGHSLCTPLLAELFSWFSVNTVNLFKWANIIFRIGNFKIWPMVAFWHVAGNCTSHCSRRVLQPLATTQSATVYINIHSAAIASAREKRRNGWLFCLVFSIRLFSKKALRLMNACRAHKSRRDRKDEEIKGLYFTPAIFKKTHVWLTS